MDGDRVIEVAHLTKRYGAMIAVDDVSFAVGRGEIFGILGPNGAGKTTMVECLTGLRQPDGGSIRVLGLDPIRAGRALRQRLGVQLQQAALPARLTVREALELYRSFYHRPVPWRPLLDRWGLTDKIETAFADLSGGQQQRLFVTLALINDPELVVLDELTAGLDPQARRLSWDLVRQIREQGTTVVLVTHFMEEAERLCDRVMVIDQGRVVALDSPLNLNRGPCPETRVRFAAPGTFAAEWLAPLPGVARIEREGNEVVVFGEGYLMAEVATALARHGAAPPDLRTEQATLEDVFIGLTGSALRA